MLTKNFAKLYIVAALSAFALPAMAQSAPRAPDTTNQSINSNPTQTSEASKEQPVEIPDSPHTKDGATLAEIAAPNDSELSIANAKLLAQNAELTRQVDDLTTQVNVLVSERTGQLFMYGALTVIGSLLLSAVIFTFLINRHR
ncbi:hypothetical protein [Moraxella pluranimalium]|uniref:SH3 domain protein n=1 Tax=Moraxella pluranimalium TaxID=470453 RepID=A0A1T0CUC5_9GAMM|nr:hypothetical protein [Moraxella pluranimalium]OOS25958.1 hypothetical protein B0680_00950 [Moraxella pluranimalium]